MKYKKYQPSAKILKSFDDGIKAAKKKAMADIDHHRRVHRKEQAEKVRNKPVFDFTKASHIADNRCLKESGQQFSTVQGGRCISTYCIKGVCYPMLFNCRHEDVYKHWSYEAATGFITHKK